MQEKPYDLQRRSMAYNLVITERADLHVEKLTAYLVYKLENRTAAMRLIEELDNVYERLEDNPYQFPMSTDAYLQRRGYREAQVKGMAYKVIIRISGDYVFVVGVFHDLEEKGKKTL